MKPRPDQLDDLESIKADADHYDRKGVAHPSRAFKLISRLAALLERKREPARKRKVRR